MHRLVVDLNFGGRLEDGRGITYLVRGDRRHGPLPDDARDGEEVLLADYEAFDDGAPAWIEIRARLVQEDDDWSAVWDWDARRWRARP